MKVSPPSELNRPIADDPLLTARPSGPRTATRIVLDSQATLSPESQLARTARLVPVLVAVSAAAPAENQQRLARASRCTFLGLPLDELRVQARQEVTQAARQYLTEFGEPVPPWALSGMRPTRRRISAR